MSPVAAAIAIAFTFASLGRGTVPPAAALSPAMPAIAQGSLPGNGTVPGSVVDVPSCVSFLTSDGGDPGVATQACQDAADLTQLFGGTLSFNKVFSCSYAQSANLVAGGQIDRSALATCLGLPPNS